MLRLLAIALVMFSGPVQGELQWEYSSGKMMAGNPVVHDGLIHVTSSDGLHVLNRDGALQWKYEPGAPSHSSVAIADGVVYLLAENGLHALDHDGNRLWLFETRDGPLLVEGTTMGWGDGEHVDPWAWYRSAPLVESGKVLFGNRQGTWAVDAKSGKKLWHAQTGTTHTRPVQHESIVIVGSWDNHLYGLNTADGSVAWKFEARLPGGKMAGWLGWEGFNLDPVIHEGVVYAGTRGTHLYAIDPKTGVENWSWKHPSSWVGSPAVVSEDIVYFGMSDGNSLVGLEARSGNQSLFYRYPFYLFARPQANDEAVFVATLSGELLRVDKTSGNGRKIFATKGSVENLKGLQNPDGGMEFISSKEGGYTIENATADVQRMLTKLDSLISLTLDGDTLYAGSANGNLYAISVR